MPKTRKSNKLVFSATKLSAIAKCHKYYEFCYLRKDIEIPTNFKFAFGIAIHRMLELFYNNNFKSEESFINYWKRYWYEIRENNNKRIGIVKVADEKARNHIFGYYKGLGTRILTSFYKRDIHRRQRLEEQRISALRGAKLLSAKAKKKKKFLNSLNLFPKVELNFRIKFRGYSIRGNIDRTDRHNNGIVFFDYKTDKRKATPDDLMVLRHPGHQFTIYDLALAELFPQYEIVGRYLLHVRTLAKDINANPLVPVRKIQKDYDLLENSLCKATEVIEKGIFERNVNYGCTFCDYYDFCLEGVVKEYEDARNQNLILSPEELEQKIEVYWEDRKE
ncbi:PD-(D/E)XK nuclease family protein [Candidatus Woesearchaeota archaeon]|nr:PD-(D/E)XK nuclease family protein [Candidatus Woesearchaeota archaeon]